MKDIKVEHVFHKYPMFYQPYVSLLLDKLKEEPRVLNTFTFFKSNEKVNHKGTSIIPSYRTRRIKETWYKFFNRNLKNLSYPEIFWLRKKTDIIHIQHSFLYPHILNLIAINPTKRPKVIVTLRGADTYVKPWVMERWKTFYALHGNKVDAFITVSNHQKAYLQSWGVESKRIHVVPISFGAKSTCKPKYPNKESIKIISAFRMCWEKNIEANIRTVKCLVDKGYNVAYDIYGDGQDVGQVYYLIHRFGLSENVFYKGAIHNKDFKSILPNYDFYLQLSLSESAGATIIEAQSKGVPCIVSNSDGLPEMIDVGKTGYSVSYYDVKEASDKIIKLYNDSDLYYSFSKQAIAFVNDNFSIEHEVERLTLLYKKLIR